MADCTYKAPSRKSGQKKRQQLGENNDQDRLRHLETLVEQLSERVRIAEHHETQAQTQAQQSEETPWSITSLPIAAASNGSSRYRVNSGTLTTDVTNNVRVVPAPIVSRDSSNNQKNPVSMPIPPLEYVLPIVEIFLERFNAALPLFHANTLLRMIHQFYNLSHAQQDPVEWAAINVVLALAHRNGLVGSSNTHLSVQYLNKVESVLSAVVLGNTQLLNIQVLIGMVFLLQATPELTQPLILIATTMRLAHKIRLHDRAASEHLDATTARQRAHVFWIAYILDKDLSMRSKQPSIQLDDDIDLDLPSSGSFDYQINNACFDDTNMVPGIITTMDGTVEMNYFLTRIQLAVIEGGVYDYLYSTRSLKRSDEERSHALESVSCALEAWKASIPFEFSTCMALNTVSPSVLPLFAVLHSTSLACTTLLNQANSWNARWVDSMRKYAIPALPPQWETVVKEARHLAVLLGSLPMQDRWSFWTTGCTHMTAIMLLTFNCLQNPHSDEISSDDKLVEDGLRMLGRMVEKTQSEVVRSFRHACGNLHRDSQRRRAEVSVMANCLDLSEYLVDP
ncbi:hypothetical protein P171DRAFT_433247 [Karstenula rhodostoma CBS 690.94]|uniref:Xylanolytic transcriptional activator regulatory domain-containing protein n=1 Tax=Karstenula rhodostoma CBS 690.94 TaxID=1392251 RepID=A0A9P4UA58_9PLEO|nr:hypothetical protein P171DRAFT_433247 [Karstenula rhodostoma CBS 690.94]